MMMLSLLLHGIIYLSVKILLEGSLVLSFFKISKSITRTGTMMIPRSCLLFLIGLLLMKVNVHAQTSQSNYGILITPSTNIGLNSLTMQPTTKLHSASLTTNNVNQRIASNMKLSYLSKTSTSTLLSKDGPSLHTFEPNIFSSVYPCFITYYVDASAVYPNQTLTATDITMEISQRKSMSSSRHFTSSETMFVTGIKQSLSSRTEQYFTASFSLQSYSIQTSTKATSSAGSRLSSNNLQTPARSASSVLDNAQFSSISSAFSSINRNGSEIQSSLSASHEVISPSLSVTLKSSKLYSTSSRLIGDSIFSSPTVIKDSVRTSIQDTYFQSSSSNIMGSSIKPELSTRASQSDVSIIRDAKTLMMTSRATSLSDVSNMKSSESQTLLPSPGVTTSESSSFGTQKVNASTTEHQNVLSTPSEVSHSFLKSSVNLASDVSSQVYEISPGSKQPSVSNTLQASSMNAYSDVATSQEAAVLETSTLPSEQAGYSTSGAISSTLPQSYLHLAPSKTLRNSYGETSIYGNSRTVSASDSLPLKESYSSNQQSMVTGRLPETLGLSSTAKYILSSNGTYNSVINTATAELHSMFASVANSGDATGGPVTSINSIVKAVETFSSFHLPTSNARLSHYVTSIAMSTSLQETSINYNSVLNSVTAESTMQFSDTKSFTSNMALEASNSSTMYGFEVALTTVHSGLDNYYSQSSNPTYSLNTASSSITQLGGQNTLIVDVLYSVDTQHPSSTQSSYRMNTDINSNFMNGNSVSPSAAISYSPNPVSDLAALSNSMEIATPSNFEQASLATLATTNLFASPQFILNSQSISDSHTGMSTTMISVLQFDSSSTGSQSKATLLGANILESTSMFSTGQHSTLVLVEQSSSAIVRKRRRRAVEGSVGINLEAGSLTSISYQSMETTTGYSTLQATDAISVTDMRYKSFSSPSQTAFGSDIFPSAYSFNAYSELSSVNNYGSFLTMSRAILSESTSSSVISYFIESTPSLPGPEIFSSTDQESLSIGQFLPSTRIQESVTPNSVIEVTSVGIQLTGITVEASVDPSMSTFNVEPRIFSSMGQETLPIGQSVPSTLIQEPVTPIPVTEISSVELQPPGTSADASFNPTLSTSNLLQQATYTGNEASSRSGNIASVEQSHIGATLNSTATYIERSLSVPDMSQSIFVATAIKKSSYEPSLAASQAGAASDLLSMFGNQSSSTENVVQSAIDSPSIAARTSIIPTPVHSTATSQAETTAGLQDTLGNPLSSTKSIIERGISTASGISPATLSLSAITSNTLVVMSQFASDLQYQASSSLNITSEGTQSLTKLASNIVTSIEATIPVDLRRSMSSIQAEVSVRSDNATSSIPIYSSSTSIDHSINTRLTSLYIMPSISIESVQKLSSEVTSSRSSKFSTGLDISTPATELSIYSSATNVQPSPSILSDTIIASQRASSYKISSESARVSRSSEVRPASSYYRSSVGTLMPSISRESLALSMQTSLQSYASSIGKSSLDSRSSVSTADVQVSSKVSIDSIDVSVSSSADVKTTGSSISETLSSRDIFSSHVPSVFSQSSVRTRVQPSVVPTYVFSIPKMSTSATTLQPSSDSFYSKAMRSLETTITTPSSFIGSTFATTSLDSLISKASTSSHTLVPAPSAKVSRILTSSLGMCIRYFTAKPPLAVTESLQQSSITTSSKAAEVVSLSTSTAISYSIQPAFSSISSTLSSIGTSSLRSLAISTGQNISSLLTVTSSATYAITPTTGTISHTIDTISPAIDTISSTVDSILSHPTISAAESLHVTLLSSSSIVISSLSATRSSEIVSGTSLPLSGSFSSASVKNSTVLIGSKSDSRMLTSTFAATSFNVLSTEQLTSVISSVSEKLPASTNTRLTVTRIDVTLHLSSSAITIPSVSLRSITEAMSSQASSSSLIESISSTSKPPSMTDHSVFSTQPLSVTVISSLTESSSKSSQLTASVISLFSTSPAASVTSSILSRPTVSSPRSMTSVVPKPSPSQTDMMSSSTKADSSLMHSKFSATSSSILATSTKASELQTNTATTTSLAHSSVTDSPKVSPSSEMLTSSTKHSSVTKTTSLSSVQLIDSSIYSVPGLSSLTSISRSTSAVIDASTIVTTKRPFTDGLVELFIRVSMLIDVKSPSYKSNFELKLVEVYVWLKSKRRRKRAATRGTATAVVSSLTRQTGSENVVAQFYIQENNVVVAAKQTADTFNQLTPQGLSQRLGQNVTGPVIIASVNASTTVPPTTIARPDDRLLFGMVLIDDPANNISTGNNRALFETKMADYYRTSRKITGTVVFKIFYLVHEPKSTVYLEFYVTVDNIRQNSSVVIPFYQSNDVTTTTLSAVLKWTVVANPYSLVTTTSLDINRVKMTIETVSSADNITSTAFKQTFALRLAVLYREARDLNLKRKRRAVGSISAIITSLTTSKTSNNRAEVIFYIIDKGSVQNGQIAATTFNKLLANRMSAVLGVAVIVVPAAVVTSPGVATSTPDYIWIIGVALGAYALVLIVATFIFWRWNIGGPKRKVDIDQIELPEKKQTADKDMSYGGYREIAKFAQGKSSGGPNMKTTSFASPQDDEDDEKPNMDPSRSMRRKVKPRDNHRPVPVARAPPPRQNPAYEESEEDDDDDVDDDDDDYESEEPQTRQPISARPVSAQRKIQVQPGPGRVAEKVQTAYQQSALEAELDEEEEDEEEPEVGTKDLATKPMRPTAAQLPPIDQLKDIQDAPTYPPVRFRTKIDPISNASEHLPPLPKRGISLTGRQLPDIDPDLKQKADLERSRNKQRQRLRASGRQESKKQKYVENSKYEKRAWKRAQSDIDALLDPMATTTSASVNKRGRRRRRFRKSHKIDIAEDTSNIDNDSSNNVKLNNYMKLNSPRQSISFDKTDDTKSEEESEVSVNEARKRIHDLLDDAFSILKPLEKKAEQMDGRAKDERLLEGKEASFTKTPPSSDDRYHISQGNAPLALPPPPHGRASTPPSGERRRVFNNPLFDSRPGTNDKDYIMPPVITKDPMVVMDRAERNRYLSQRLGQPLYSTSPGAFAYVYDQPPSQQRVYITPVQQQPDGLGGVIWSPYAAEAVKDDINSNAAPLFNTMESPELSKYKLKSTPIRGLNDQSVKPTYTSIDMRNTPYDTPGLRETPQPLIRAIKEELLRLSQTARGKTRIEELGNTS